MAQPLWQQLSTLASLDQEIASIALKLQQTTTEIAHVQEISKNLHSQFEVSQKAWKDLKKKVAGIDLKIKEIDERFSKKKQALESCSNEKEYKGLKKEIAVLEIEHQDYEDQLVSGWHDLESTEKKRDGKMEAIEQQKNKELAELEVLEEKNEKLQQTHMNTVQQRNDLTQKLQGKWLEIYNKMKNKVSDPIVPALNSSCSSCYYQILHQDLASLRKNALMHCRNCYRLLYVPTEEYTKNAKEAY